MYLPVFSSSYCHQYRQFTTSDQQDIDKAIQRVLIDPNLNQYKRYYIIPYLQEHPTNKQLTIFFEILEDSKKVFFVWVNSYEFLHDTRMSFGEDPCVKEFLRLKSIGELEVYDQNVHVGEFSIKPRSTDPSFFKFSKYNASVFSNISSDDETYFSMSIESFDEPEDIFDHYGLFCEKIRDHFKSINKSFEFRIPIAFNEELINELDKFLKAPAWQISTEDELKVYRMI